MYKPELLRFFGNIKNGLPLSLSTFLVVYSYFLYLTDWLFDISFTQTNSYFSLSILFNLNVHLKGGKRMMQVCHIDYHRLGGNWLLIAALILSFHFHFLIFHINFFESLIFIGWGRSRGQLANKRHFHINILSHSLSNFYLHFPFSHSLFNPKWKSETGMVQVWHIGWGGSWGQ